jgi:hypothetical protein
MVALRLNRAATIVARTATYDARMPRRREHVLTEQAERLF